MPPLILEHVVLPVIAGREEAFLDAFAEARPWIEASPGFVSLELHRGIERSNEFLMLVRWQTLEAHTVGFRGSPAYARWRELLHHFYDPFPEVLHFEC